jgi:hypothetical protein
VERIEYLFRSVSSQATCNKLVVRDSITLERGRLSCNVTNLRCKNEIVATVTMSAQVSLIQCQLTVKGFLFLLCVLS